MDTITPGPTFDPDPRQGSRRHRPIQGRRLVASDLQPLSSRRQGILELVLRFDRTRDDALHGVKGFNVKEDRRHDRRTSFVEELRQTCGRREQGPTVMGMTGPARALCYRLAVAIGLRFEEITSITRE